MVSKSSKRKAVSTILGVLIFIGVVFSAIVPMQLTMKQADIHAQKILNEESRKDEEQSLEHLTIYAYPTGAASDEIAVRIMNDGRIALKAIRIWIKDDQITIDEPLNPGEVVQMGPYTVDLVSGTSYPVKVTTERGNIFTTNSGTIYYEDGTWYTTSLGISVNIGNYKGKFEIEVYDDEPSLIGYYKTSGEDQGDLEKFFEVAYPGTYTVYVSEFTGHDWVPLDDTPAEVVIMWPGGTPIVFLYLTGIPP